MDTGGGRHDTSRTSAPWAPRRTGRGIAVATLPQLVALVSVAAQTAPSRPVDTDINSYVLFGFDTVDFKGGNLTGRGIISGGNVGANGLDPGAPDPTVSICANGRAVMSDGSQVVGATVRLARECVFWDLFANRTVGEGGATLHSGPTPVSIPAVSEPPFPSVTCDPARPVTVRNGDPATTLPPGRYGAVEFQNGTDVTLGAGLYEMCSFHTGQHATVRIGAGTELRITGSFALGDDTTLDDDSNFGVGLACAARIYVRGDGVTSNDATIRFGEHSVVAGHFLTLTGRINLGRNTTLFGTFWAENISSDFNVNVTYCPPLGEFPFTKTVTGPGAGSQGLIQIDITCVPSPPNGSIPPFTIPAGSPAGAYSTVVTGVTLPAVCRAHETIDGDNEAVIVPLGRSAVQAEAVVCPDVGHVAIDPFTGRRRSLPPATLVDTLPDDDDGVVHDHDHHDHDDDDHDVDDHDVDDSADHDHAGDDPAGGVRAADRGHGTHTHGRRRAPGPVGGRSRRPRPRRGPHCRRCGPRAGFPSPNDRRTLRRGHKVRVG